MLTVLLYVVIPKGFFPVQDTGLIQAHHRGAADRLLRRDGASASRRWPRAILKDPDVASLSSFIGVDGTNTTLNSGRLLINLKPKDDRSDNASDDHPPAAAGDAQTSPASRSTCSRCRT